MRAEGGMHVAPAAGHLAHSSDDGVGSLLEDVAGGAGGEGLAHVVRIVLHREDQDLGLGGVLKNLWSRLDAALSRHDDVHQDHVGVLGPRLEHGVLGIAGLPDDLDVGFGLEHLAQATPDDGMVVDDQNADGRVAHDSGTSATIVVPAPWLDSIFSLPPNSANRSPMPRSPRPSPLPSWMKPRPSSSISAVTAPVFGARTMLTAVACACLMMSVSASWTMR